LRTTLRTETKRQIAKQHPRCVNARDVSLRLTILRRITSPVHEGTPTIWHLATVLDWLKNRANYEIDDGLWEVAKTNRLLNLARELHDLDAEPAFQRDLMRLMATLDKTSPDFMVDRKQPARQKRESAFD
jgi:hypothetical protein